MSGSNSKTKIYRPVITHSKESWDYNFVLRNDACTAPHSFNIEFRTGGAIVIVMDSQIVAHASPPPLWRSIKSRILWLFSFHKFKKGLTEEESIFVSKNYISAD